MISSDRLTRLHFAIWPETLTSLSSLIADSTGTHSLYTTYKDYELMFHVSTMLPYTPNNRQQVSKLYPSGSVFCSTPPTMLALLCTQLMSNSFNKSLSKFLLGYHLSWLLPIFPRDSFRHGNDLSVESTSIAIATVPRSRTLISASPGAEADMLLDGPLSVR